MGFIFRAAARHWGIILIIVVGLGLRLYALDYGLPRLYFPDEEFFTAPALRVAAGHINPDWFGAPAQPMIYALGATFAVVNNLTNWQHGTTLSVSDNYQHDPTPFQIAGRAGVALGGAIMIAATYLLGRLWRPAVGLLAAGLVSGSFYLVDYAHIIRPDTWQATFLLLAAYGLIKIINQPTARRWWWLFGVCFGLATTTKYPSLFLLIPVAALAVIQIQRRLMTVRQWLAIAAIVMATMFVSGPFLFLTPLRAAHDLILENRADHGQHSHLGFIGNLKNYAVFLNWQVGTVWLAIAGWSIVAATRRRFKNRNLDERGRRTLGMALAVTIYVVCLSMLQLNWDRWLITVLPFVFLLAAVGFMEIFQAGCKRLATVLLILALIGPGLRLGRVIYGLAHDYSVETARQWIETNVPAGDTVLVEPEAPDISVTKFNVRREPNVTARSADEFIAAGVDYFVTSSVRWEIVAGHQTFPEHIGYRHATKLYDSMTATYRRLARSGPTAERDSNQLIQANDFLVASSWSFDVIRGPVVEIYSFESK